MLLISATVLANLSFAAPIAQAASQNHYLWRNDNGTSVAAEDTPLVISHNSSKRLRLNVDSTSSDLGPTLAATLDTSPFATDEITATVIDTAAGYAYLGSNGNDSTHAQIIKVRLSDFTPVARLNLGSYLDQAVSAVIDTTGATHYAYFGIERSLDDAHIVKIDLSTFTKVGVIDVPAPDGEFNPNSAVIDTTGATPYAYFGLSGDTSGHVLRLNLATTGIDEIALNSGEGNPNSAVIDTTGATPYAYFGTDTSPGHVAKINLATFHEEGTALALHDGENQLVAAVIDTVDGFAYFGTGDTDPGLVAKIDLSTFLEDGTAAPLSTGGFIQPASAAIDVTGATHYAYFGVGALGTPGHVVKFNLTSLVEESSIPLPDDGNLPSVAAIDPAGGFLYVPHVPQNRLPAAFSEISLSSFTVTSTIVFGYFNNDLESSVIDTVHGFAYFNSSASGKLVKVRLSDFAKVGELDLGQAPYAAVIDPMAGYAYFGMYDSSPKVIKRVNLSTFAVDATLPLTGGETAIQGATIDPTAGYAYFGVYFRHPSRVGILRVQLSDFTEAGVLALDSSQGNINAGYVAAADPDRGRVYFATFHDYYDPGIGDFVIDSHLLQIDESSFAVTGDYQSLTDESHGAVSLALDTVNQNAYIGTYNGDVDKVDLATMTRVGTLALTEGTARGAVIDPANGFAYFAIGTNPTTIVKVDLATFTEVNALKLGDSLAHALNPVLDADHGYLYMSADIIGQVQLEANQPRAYRLEYGENTSTCAAVSSWTQVGAPSGPEAWTMADSAHVANGEATSDLPALTNGGSFVAGQAMDTASQTGPITMTAGESTEVEFSVMPTSAATPGADWCFRLTDAGSALNVSSASYAEARSGTDNPTTANSLTLSRLKAGEVTTADVRYHLADTLDGLLTVTFPAGFTVLTPATGGSGCLDDFNSTTSTLTARKTGCSGDVVMTGATVRNPATPGDYPITWVNDDPGGSSVYIMSDDQVGVDATVEPSISFSVGAQAAATPCSGAFTGDGGVVALGVIPLGQVVSSDVNGVSHICTRLSTNAASGATVTVKSDNAALMSSSNHADLIPSLTANGGDNVMHAGTANYGLCADGVSGVADTTPESAPVLRNDPFKTICTDHTAAGNVGAVTTSAQTIWHVEHATSNAYQSLEVKAAISGTTAAHSDYGDTLTFVATGTF